MKKQLNKVPKLKKQNGTLSCGFASLNTNQMSKINGGKKNPLETNSSCTNVADCTQPQNESCVHVACS